jgi:hypothetical protein
MVAAITGVELEIDTGFDNPPARGPRSPGRPRWWRVALGAALVAAIVGLNTFNFYLAKRPPGNFLPEYRLLAPEPADRLLTEMAGAYETGGEPGDRRLQIGRNGGVQWIQFGPGRAVATQRDFAVQPVTTADSQGLLTDRQTLIQIKDSQTLIYFGDRFARVTQ